MSKLYMALQVARRGAVRKGGRTALGAARTLHAVRAQHPAVGREREASHILPSLAFAAVARPDRNCPPLLLDRQDVALALMEAQALRLDPQPAVVTPGAAIGGDAVPFAAKRLGNGVRLRRGGWR